MRASVYYENGSPDVFRYEDVPDPQITDDEILIRVAAIGIQGGDVLNRQGGDLTSSPHIVGYQASGIVEAVGASVTSFSIGDRVVSLGMNGSHAERRAAHHSRHCDEYFNRADEPRHRRFERQYVFQQRQRCLQD